jgi:hypothetical protein
MQKAMLTFIAHATEKKYEKLLQLSPTNRNLLRHYASFLMYVKNDVDASHYYVDLANDLEESEARKRKEESMATSQIEPMKHSRTDLANQSVLRMRKVKTQTFPTISNSNARCNGAPMKEIALIWMLKLPSL